MSAYTKTQSNITQTSSVAGSIEIAPDVIETIAYEAARQFKDIQVVNGSGNYLQGIFSRRRGVALYQNAQDQIVLDIHVMINYGLSVPKLCLALQQHVIEQVLFMTDYELSHVNVHVVGFNTQVAG
ncbi:hypothetical protein AWM75_02135 [Aerococcus urinaehominis]|uniref:Uncharacterized protein n=1 Tax=Aerococcus urinaehominis TaxID=128944 RepID=A0A0X8FKF3_9LACT|nr:Asp23/Gls24 family envelope stress response protein [Aerococcus urinaehominis]AMB98862.1 hypothetical protein AWM75_02135 [Aerococcus urinaehominis]SDM16848.1 Uncharacterized conserved protein YloU, alkaline shock protein (Asp23) family [Aerococcus urinaehominis]